MPDAESKIAHQLADAVEASSDETGWASLARVGSLVSNHSPDFDPRHYGFKKLSDLVEALGTFEVTKRGDKSEAATFVRMKSSQPASR